MNSWKLYSQFNLICPIPWYSYYRSNYNLSWSSRFAYAFFSCKTFLVYLLEFQLGQRGEPDHYSSILLKNCSSDPKVHLLYFLPPVFVLSCSNLPVSPTPLHTLCTIFLSTSNMSMILRDVSVHMNYSFNFLASSFWWPSPPLNFIPPFPWPVFRYYPYLQLFLIHIFHNLDTPPSILSFPSFSCSLLMLSYNIQTLDPSMFSLSASPLLSSFLTLSIWDPMVLLFVLSLTFLVLLSFSLKPQPWIHSGVWFFHIHIWVAK